VINGEEGVVEPQDQLAIMYKDTGPKATAMQLDDIEGSVVAEIIFNDKGRKSYAYVLEGNPEKSTKNYTYFDRETGLISKRPLIRVIQESH
jgi:hypothetical protein